jgi:hypothetical protein
MNASTLDFGRKAPRIPFEVRTLLSALQLSRPDAAPLKKLSNEEWTSLLAFCDISHLTLPIARLPMEGFPDWAVERLRTNLADNSLRFERVKATYREAAEALKQAAIEHLVIKGFTQSPDYVADPRLRAQSDIDIFCLPKDIDAANSALQTIGYRPSGTRINYDRADHVVPLVRPGKWRWRGNPFDPEMPLGIELHFCLWNERVSQIRIPETGHFWERRITRTIDGLSFSCLSPVDHLGYLALHILRNLFLGDWIVHHVRELAVFLHSHADNEAFWQTWNETHSPSLRSFEAIAFYYARAWFDCRLHPQAAYEIDRLSATRRSWLNCFSGSALELMFHGNKDSLWLHLGFLSSHKEKWMTLKRRLIPTRVGSIGSPAIQVRNRRVLQSHDSPLWRQYIAYLLSRSADHGRANMTTLTRFLSWRLFQHSRARNLPMDTSMRD